MGSAFSDVGHRSSVAEQLFRKQQVNGSNPFGGSILFTRPNMNEKSVLCLLCKSDSHTEVESHNGDPYRESGSITRTVICDRCGLVFANPQPGNEQIEKKV